MNRQLTVVLVAVVGIVALAGGAFLFTGQSGGADVAPAANDAAAAVEQSTPTSQSNEPTEQPTPTDTTTESDTTDAGDADDESVARANEPPTADAGEDVTAREWTLTTLDATGSTDSDGDDANLTYEWTQVAGEEVELRGADTATPKFFPPESKLNTQLTFEVTVTDADGASATDTVVVTVTESRDDDKEEPTNASEDGNQTDVDDADSDGGQTAEDDSETSDDSTVDDGDSTVDDGDSDADDTSAKASNDTIAQATFGSDFDELSTEDAATVYELYLRQPDGDWDPASVQTREELAQEKYGDSFENLGFDARVDVQESFDAQFGDTGGALSKDEISQAKWGHDFRNVSVDSAGQIVELYDRQPWVNEDNKHMPTRGQLAYRIYDTSYDDPLDGLTREQRLDIERRYNAQFDTE
ncbi:pkd domain protein [Halogeometricum sp. S1BR25-6]|uniref:Pkd domain protein n=1 Tax=Halogeometricum salsisoli TaxID=2950536 RepID=A0ABU2GGP5_9EURY|nr:pkd domain protein [Halogeometricum sp. S1BR25-6]MDS0299987.1 pkd domain protein [Halogeometricum sp. S1BR25-6]